MLFAHFFIRNHIIIYKYYLIMIKVNLVSKLNFVLFMHFESMGDLAKQTKKEERYTHTCDRPPVSELNNENVQPNNSSNSCNSAGGLTDAQMMFHKV